MTLATLLSSFAMILSIGGIVPQLLRMARARSSAGQSPLGWAMGVAANASMAYVNGVAFGSALLLSSSVASGALCLAALTLVVRYAGSDSPERALAAPAARPAHDAVHDLATQEFEILRDAVLDIDRQRRAVAVPVAA
jgi:hypothetical protein